MDLRKLKTLIDLVEASDISELELTEGEEKVKISRQNNTGSSLPPANYVQQPIQPTVNQQPQVQSEVPSDKVETAQQIIKILLLHQWLVPFIELPLLIRLLL